jgi:5'-nucleotidase
VVSGINGGPNLGHEWFGSGTIGAARTAALGGIPAIAVSGLDQSIPGAVKAACRWVVALSQSPVVRQLQPGQYLTVSIPRVSPDEIKGIRVLPRAAIDVSYLPRLVPETGKQETGKRQRWIMEPPSGQPVPIHDIKGYQERWIVIVPMKVDEVDYSFMKELQTKVDPFPPWPKKG